MNLLQKATLEAAYAKLGFYGEAGSGKTYTASLVAIGLQKYIKSKKPIAFAATEPGVDYVMHLFKDSDVELVVAKTRVFADLITDDHRRGIIDEAEEECSVLIIDSISHYWLELQESWMKKNGLNRINWIKHSAPIKAIWRDFTDRYINSKLHIIVCGRSTVIFEDTIDPEDGSRETKKVGTKMKTENEMGYEPSLLMEMSAAQMEPRFGEKIVRRVFIKKDRFSVMDGMIFDNPTFETFLPHISKLNIGGIHRAVDTEGDSQRLIESPRNGEQRAITRDILCEKIMNEIKLLYPGRTEADTAARLKLMNETFATNSWTEIEKRVPMQALEIGLAKIKAIGMPAPVEEPKQKAKKGGKS